MKLDTTSISPQAMDLARNIGRENNRTVGEALIFMIEAYTLMATESDNGMKIIATEGFKIQHEHSSDNHLTGGTDE